MRIVLIVCISVFLLSSCKKMIDLAPPSEMSEGDFYQTGGDIEQAVTACYGMLQSEGQYGLNYVFLMEIRSDNASLEDFSKSGARYGDIEAFNESTANPVIEQAWRDSYKGIQYCNAVLANIDEVEMSDMVKAERKGEVYFLRALTYFNLVRLWGDVPLITEKISDPFKSFGTPRTPADKIYAQIKEDLNNAVDMLPVNPSEPGRAGKGAAQVLLGKVHLTLHNYMDAASILQTVIQSGAYELQENFEDVFKISNENNSEIIFSIQYMGGSEGEGSGYSNQFAPQGVTSIVGGIGKTSGDNTPTASLYRAYAQNDKRLEVTIGLVPDGRFYNKKYLSTPVLPESADNNFIVLRYADVLLMAAEALNEIGYNTAEPFEYINAIRSRAGLKEFTSNSLKDQAAVRSYIADERQRELAFENHRWFDLLRTGKALEVMNSHEVYGTQLNMGQHQVVFPIPQRELNTDPNGMIQNPGY